VKIRNFIISILFTLRKTGEKQAPSLAILI